MSVLVPLPDPSRDDNGESLGDRAYLAIRRAIITCALPPGTEVSETQLAARFGFGKAPVRAALSRLAQDRLVRAQAMPVATNRRCCRPKIFRCPMPTNRAKCAVRLPKTRKSGARAAQPRLR